MKTRIDSITKDMSTRDKISIRTCIEALRTIMYEMKHEENIDEWHGYRLVLGYMLDYLTSEEK